MCFRQDLQDGQDGGGGGLREQPDNRPRVGPEDPPKGRKGVRRAKGWCVSAEHFQETKVSCLGDLGLLKLARTNDASVSGDPVRNTAATRPTSSLMVQLLTGDNRNKGIGLSTQIKGIYLGRRPTSTKRAAKTETPPQVQSGTAAESWAGSQFRGQERERRRLSLLPRGVKQIPAGVRVKPRRDLIRSPRSPLPGCRAGNQKRSTKPAETTSPE